MAGEIDLFTNKRILIWYKYTHFYKHLIKNLKYPPIPVGCFRLEPAPKITETNIACGVQKVDLFCCGGIQYLTFGPSIFNCMLLLMILIFSNKMASSCGFFSTTETSPVIYEYSAVFSPCQCEPHNFRHILDGNSKKNRIPSIQTNWETENCRNWEIWT